MKKIWYYKLLFSYLPVFFLIVSFLFFVSFQALSERAEKDTARIYTSINQQLMQTVEQTLRSIDHLMVTMQTRNSIGSDFSLLNFFNQEGQPSAYFTFQLSKEFNNMRQLNPIISNIYLVRERDGYVASTNTVAPLERFPDKPFIQQLMKEPFSYHWTNSRSFKEFAASRSEEVVSLARKYVTNRGESGLMVVNVQTDALAKLVSQSFDQSSSYLTITGKEDHPIIPVLDGDKQKRASMSSIRSEYTGWVYESGLVKNGGLLFVQAFSPLWIITACAGVMLGMVAIIYMTNRNYKPLRTLINRLDELSAASGEQRGGQNEFHYIEATLNAMMERFDLFKTQADLNIGYRKKSIFMEVMNGSRSLANEEWRQEMALHGLAGGLHHAVVIVVSIDKYPDIQARFNEQDMLLYRFVVQNVYMELLQKQGLRSWSEWVNDKEMCGFIYMGEDGSGDLLDQVKLLIEQLLPWIRRHLPFTVTVGIGQPADSVPELKHSFQSAMQAISSRAVFGNNRLIGYWETGEASSLKLYPMLEEIRRLLYAFRMMEPDWRSKYNELFRQFREHKLKRDEIINLLHFMTFHLFDYIRGAVLNDEMAETNQVIVKDVIDQFETLEDVQEEILGIMEKLEYRVQERSSRGSASSIAMQMKEYIDEQVSNPDLSLVHLSERFNMPSKNISALFKEQFNIKFIDFLIHLRVELAKRLLVETELSIQEIGQKVGYLNPVSFNRVFKRVVGIPPGDYRKEHQG
ncbi:helix-turn-helix domain-containing protein [Paenibacillaceae bacterium]|nr:helix-turn-helix domain-containing protein [Paenibacillaceae bacterium]